MDSSAFWEVSGSTVRVPVKFESGNTSESDVAISIQPCKEEPSLFQFCDGNLNFTTVATSEDDEFSFNKKKLSRDPMSHRIIEKRRRDRMNNCLADLSRLIPADYMKKGRGRIEKTEIIEMAIKHMKHLQTGAPTAGKKYEYDVSEQAPTPEQPTSLPIDTEHYRLGYLECLSEAMHFMVEVEGFYAGDPLCVQLINHLQKHCDKILRGDRLSYPLAHGKDSTSNSSGSSVRSHPQHNGKVFSSGSSPDFRNDRSSRMTEGDVVDLTRPSQLRDMLTSPNQSADNSQSRSRLDAGVSAASLYKFKNNIKQRFSAEGDGSSKRRRFELHSDTCSSPPTSPREREPPHLQAAHVPTFALHPKGSHYVPLTLDADVLVPYFNYLDLLGNNDLHSLILHPVTISVNFNHTNNLKVETRPSRKMSSVKNEYKGFDRLPDNSLESPTVTRPSYKKYQLDE